MYEEATPVEEEDRMVLTDLIVMDVADETDGKDDDVLLMDEKLIGVTIVYGYVTFASNYCMK